MKQIERQDIKTVITSYSIHYTKLYEYPKNYQGSGASMDRAPCRGVNGTAACKLWKFKCRGCGIFHNNPAFSNHLYRGYSL